MWKSFVICLLLVMAASYMSFGQEPDGKGKHTPRLSSAVSVPDSVANVPVFLKNPDKRTYPDTTRQYYNNGRLKRITVKDNLNQNLYMAGYAEAGWLEFTSTRYKGNKNHEIRYHRNGSVKFDIWYQNGHAMNGAYTYLYDNGKPERTVVYNNRKVCGPNINYYPSGKIKTETVIDTAANLQKITNYYESGRIKSYCAYLGDSMLADGPYTSYYENGTKQEDAYFVKGKRCGISTRYFDGGQRSSERKFDSGLLVRVKCYDTSGKTLLEKQGTNIRHYATFYEDGSKKCDMDIDSTGLSSGILRFYTHSGTVYEEGEYLDGRRHGATKRFFPNGMLKQILTYKKGKLDGNCIAYYSSGMLDAIETFSADKRNGHFAYYHPSGVLKESGSFVDDLINDTLYAYNINGELESRTAYCKGTVLEKTIYDTAGNILEVVKYPQEGGPFVEHGKAVSTFIETEGSMSHGRVEGTVKSYYSNGQLRKRSDNSDGFSNGAFVVYHLNGVTWDSCTYKNGSKEGSNYIYDLVGKLDAVRNYREGKLYGRQTFYDLGRKSSTEIRNDVARLDSQIVFYGEEDKVACIIYCNDGDITGYTYYNKNNELVPVISLKHGSGKIKAYYPNGQLSVEMTYKNNEAEGPSKIYYSNGVLAETMNCKNGLANGEMMCRSFDNSLLYKATFTNGEFNGPAAVYDGTNNLLASANYYYGHLHGDCILKDATGKLRRYKCRYGNLMQVD